jgi:phage recombination protein Bet
MDESTKSETSAAQHAVWTQERIDLVRRTVCPPGLTDDEFALFIEQCKRSGLDPLLKEAFCVPRRQNVGNRDRPNWVTRHEFQPSETGMLARAERFPDFRGVQASAVFAEDEILIDQGKGEVVHRFNPTRRKGPIVGAWARIVRENKLPIVVWLDFEGYAQSTPLWAKIPTTMIEKCARVAVLRKAYPEAFGGLYIREEMPAEEFGEAAAAAPAPEVAGSRTLQTKSELAQRVARMGAPRQPAVVEDAPAPAVVTGAEAAPKQAEPKQAELLAKAVEASAPAAAASTAVVLGFGPHKGRPLGELSDDELSDAMELAHEKLAESPKARWARAMQENLTALEAEVERRMTPVGGRARGNGRDASPTA